MRLLSALIFVCVAGYVASSSCVNSSGTLNSWQLRNYEKVLQIYTNVQYPKNVAIIQGGCKLDGLFHPNVSGRINPIGNFTDAQGACEYFYALTPNPFNTIIPSVLGKLVLIGFSSMCPEVAAVSGYVPIIKWDTTKPDNLGDTIGYIHQTGFYKFNDKGEIINYHLILESFQEVLTVSYGDQSKFSVQQEVKALICKVHTDSCLGADKQYDNFIDCFTQLSLKPYGYFWDSWSDTVSCRLLHAVLAQVDPHHHCPHIGPSGGGKCVDYPYRRKYFEDDQQLYGSKTAFICPGTPPSTC